MLISSIVIPSSMNSVSMKYLMLLPSMIMWPAWCSPFAACNHADHRLWYALGFELCSAPTMAELVGFAAKLAGLLRISRHYSPRSRAYHVAHKFLLLLEFLARLQPLLADGVHGLFVDGLIDGKPRPKQGRDNHAIWRDVDIRHRKLRLCWCCAIVIGH